MSVSNACLVADFLTSVHVNVNKQTYGKNRKIYLLMFISQSLLNPLHHIQKSFSPDNRQLQEQLMRSSRKYLDGFVSHWASPEKLFI